MDISPKYRLFVLVKPPAHSTQQSGDPRAPVTRTMAHEPVHPCMHTTRAVAVGKRQFCSFWLRKGRDMLLLLRHVGFLEANGAAPVCPSRQAEGTNNKYTTQSSGEGKCTYNVEVGAWEGMVERRGEEVGVGSGGGMGGEGGEERGGGRGGVGAARS
jgi:hypothetical protein